MGWRDQNLEVTSVGVAAEVMNSPKVGVAAVRRAVVVSLKVNVYRYPNSIRISIKFAHPTNIAKANW